MTSSAASSSSARATTDFFLGKVPRKFNGKPMSYWQKVANRLVIECLIMAAQIDVRSLPGSIASRRLLELASNEGPEVFKEVMEQRALFMRNLLLFRETFALSKRRAAK